MQNSLIAVIINSFNRVNLLIESLKTLSNSIYENKINYDFVAIVYEAGSTDGSYEWLISEGKKLKLPIHVITPKCGDDTSFSAGINSAVAYAEKKYKDLKYILFYETDNQILNFTPISQAINQLESNDQLAACGFTVRHLDGSPAGVGQPFPTLLNFALGKNVVTHFDLEAISYRWQYYSEDIIFSKVDVVYTSPLLVKINAWKDSAGMDASVFPFSDCDVDWARRLRNKGWIMGVIKTNDVIHDNLSSFSAWSSTRAIHSHRGRLNYFRRHRPIGVLIVWPVLLLVRHTIELISSWLVKDPKRRSQLTSQFSFLFVKSLSGYN